MGTPMVTPGQYQQSTSRPMGPPMGRPVASMQTSQHQQAVPRAHNYPPPTTPIAQSPRSNPSGGRGMERGPHGQASFNSQVSVNSQPVSNSQGRANNRTAKDGSSSGGSQEDWAKKAAMWAKRDQMNVSDVASKATPKHTPRNSPYRTPIGDQTPLVDEDR